MTKLLGVPPEFLPDTWPLVEPLIVKACSESGGRFTAADVAAKVSTGEFQLWIAQSEDEDEINPVQALGLTRLVAYPRLTACEVMATLGRDMKDWSGHINGISEWAARHGATQMHVIARPGWEKVLKREGYRKTHIFLERDI